MYYGAMLMENKKYFLMKPDERSKMERSSGRMKMAIHAALIALFLMAFQAPALAVLVTEGVEDFSAGSDDWYLYEAMVNADEQMAFIGASTAFIYQEIQLEPWHKTLHFDYRLCSQTAYEQECDFFSVILSGDSGSIVLYDQEIYDRNDSSFTPTTIDLTAWDLSALWGSPGRLLFQLADGNPFRMTDLYLDNVVVRPVPEPATLVLFGTGLVGVGVYRRSRVAKRR